MVLRRVGVWSVARIFGTLYACIGLIVHYKYVNVGQRRLW